MIVTYTPADPADGEPQSWSFNPRRVKATVCMIIEKAAGRPYGEWAEAALVGDVAAVRVLLWYLRKQTHPVLRLDDVDFYVDEVEVRADSVELRDMRDRVAAVPLKSGVTEAERAEVLAKIDEELAEIEAAEPGKAL